MLGARNGLSTTTRTFVALHTANASRRRNWAGLTTKESNAGLRRQCKKQTQKVTRVVGRGSDDYATMCERC